MKIALASDHAGFELKEILIKELEEKGHNVSDYGTYSNESIDYADFAYVAARSVAEHNYNFGIIICGSGVGVSITANKVNGIRAANCCNNEIAALARQHNDANILCLGARFVTVEDAIEMVDTFMNTKFEGGRHQRRIEKIHDLTGC
ncbi:MAG: ribose 5-phosphate isomerase B [Ignavibacteriae bacterium HGW-Ignavibacteriae-4]|jgi:ribose 5-phosphate isomerase B|nr:MAG: ribose 5-phosphate isomerase B [Ignavibacteriae bacterium HGW-Ignavibacteriae-4]